MTKSKETTPEYILDSDGELLDVSDTETLEPESDNEDSDVYELVSLAEISKKTKIQVETVKNVLPNDTNISTNAIRYLLNQQRWDVEGTCEKILDQPKKFLKNAKLIRSNSVGSNSQDEQTLDISHSLTSDKTCSICFEAEFELVHNPNCSTTHSYCESCYSYQVYTKITTEGLTDSIACIHPNCSVLLEPSFTETLLNIGSKYHPEPLSTKAKDMYNRFILNSTVSNNPQLQSCFRPGCSQMFWIKRHCKAMELRSYQASGILNSYTYVRTAGHGDESELLQPELLKLSCFKCKAETCFNCGLEYHYPATCDQMKKWDEKSKDDSETKNWMQANTKPCPKCNTLIEKNSGCNHMTCKKADCRYEFCWLCLQHTTSHLGHANCDQEAHKRMQENAASSKKKLDRYLTYFNHSNAHRNSLVNIDRVNKSINYLVKKMGNSTQTANMENNLLESSLDFLIFGRKTLQYVYVFAYFINEIKSTDSAIFKMNLDDLNNSIEKLSNMLENELRLKYELDKQKAAILSKQQFGFEVSPEQYKKLQKVSPFPEQGKIIKRNGMDHNNYRQFMNIMQDIDGQRLDPFVNFVSSRKRKSNNSTSPYDPIRLNEENFPEFCMKIRDQEKFCRERLNVVLEHIKEGFKNNYWFKKKGTVEIQDEVDPVAKRFSSTIDPWMIAF